MFRNLSLSLILLVVCPGSLFAGPVRDAFVQVELVTDTASIRPGAPFWVGLRMDMDDEWHVYWKNPGDSGLPTVIRWDLPDGFAAGDIHWPFPIRMDYPELTSYGYGGEVILLSRITPPEDLPPGAPQTIRAHVTWLSCKNMCVQGKADLSLELPVRDAEPSVNGSVREMFKKTMLDWPLTESEWGVQAHDRGDSFRLRLTPPEGEASGLAQAAFFPEENDMIDHTAGQTLEEINGVYELVVRKSAVGRGDVQRLKGVLVSPDGWQEGRRALFVDVPVRNDH